MQIRLYQFCNWFFLNASQLVQIRIDPFEHHVVAFQEQVELFIVVSSELMEIGQILLSALINRMSTHYFWMLPRRWFFLITYCIAFSIFFDWNSTILLNVGQAAYKLLVGPEGNALMHLDPSTTATLPACRNGNIFGMITLWSSRCHAFRYLGKFINGWESSNVDNGRYVWFHFFSVNFHK